MSVGIDESGKYYVCQREHRYSKAYDDYGACLAEAKRMGFGLGLIAISGHTVTEKPAPVIAPPEPEPAPEPVAVAEPAPSVLAKGGRAVVAAIKEADYTDEQLASLIAEEQAGKRRKMVLRALGWTPAPRISADE